MALFDQTFKDEVRTRNDIVEVVSSYVKLERRGNRFVGLCPFHGEKTPSFHVIPHLQIYHCFGCKASGDVFKFVQERDHLSFHEAVILLAKRAHIALPQEERTPEEEKAYLERRGTLDALEFAARYYQAHLQSEAGAAARAYLERRGLTEETIRQFRIGWATGRLNQSARQRFSPEVLERAGLIVPRRQGPGFMDAFFDRVMFPITDLNGRIIGFGGRILEGSAPKYKNTAETPVFSKRQVLFGLSQAKEAIRTRNQAVLVEGYMDVIMPYQVGVKNVVAPLGTALTDDQCRTLRRQAEQVIVAFDSDTAGQMATLRGLEKLYDTGCDVRILRLPDGKDPDEFIRAHGVEGFQRCIDEAIPLVEFKLRLALDHGGKSTPEAKAKAVESVARVLIDLKNDVLREEYTHRVANELSDSPLDVPEVKRAIARQMNRLLRQGFQHNQTDSRNNIRDSGSENGPALPAPRTYTSAPASRDAKVTEADLVWKAERTLVLLLLENPALTRLIQSALGETPFIDPLHSQVYRSVGDAYAHGGYVAADAFLPRVLDFLPDPDARPAVTEMAATPVVSANWEQEAGDCIEKIMQHRVSRRIEDLENQMKAIQAAGDRVPDALYHEWTQLQIKRKKAAKP
ncbi:MAG TPA: DNA primase [Symbiobacteriaceae bacterium]